MWIFGTKFFLSIVKHRDEETLIVRSRLLGDLESVFPDRDIERTPAYDYAYRAFLSKEDVKEALCKYIDNLEYDNFKDSIKEDQTRKGIMFRVWLLLEGFCVRAEQQRREKKYESRFKEAIAAREARHAETG